MRYKVVGYGSLLSHDSLKETIKDKKFIPVVVKGYKRIFDLRDGERDFLDVEKSKDLEFNGVLFEVDGLEFSKLQEREDGYVPREVEVIDFYTEENLGECFLFIDYVDVDYEKQKPDKSYFLLCREAAYSFGEEFGKFWDKTTYLSDGQRVSDWILKNKKLDKVYFGK